MIEDDLAKMRGLVQRNGWGLFMRTVGSLMAEQVEWVAPSEQSTELFNCSCTIHTLDPFFEKCGRFEYPPEVTIE